MSDVATSLSVIADRWLLLIHQLPAKPAYLRVKVWRRLRALGAVAVKNAVYALPANEQTQEDFEWLLKEITEGGGEAMICEALTDGVSDREVRSLVLVAILETPWSLFATCSELRSAKRPLARLWILDSGSRDKEVVRGW